jgi:hypothetical protein
VSRGTAIVAMLIAVAVAVRLGLPLLGWPASSRYLVGGYLLVR